MLNFLDLDDKNIRNMLKNVLFIVVKIKEKG